MKPFRSIAFLAAAAAALIPAAASATIEVNINNVGSDVVATASGSFDLTGFTDVGSFGLDTGVRGDPGYIGTGSPSFTDVEGYSGLTGPSLFGTGGYFIADTVSGDPFAFNADYLGAQYIFFAPGYAGGAILSSDTWLNQSIASLGLTPGTYLYTSASDNLIINIGQPTGAVPEPATWAMMLLGFGAIGWAFTRKRRRAGSLQLA